MVKGNRLQPADTDVDVLTAFLASWQAEFFAFGCAGTDKDGVVTLLQQGLHAFHRMIQKQINAHVGDVGNFLIEHFLRQTERGYVRAHQTARHR